MKFRYVGMKRLDENLNEIPVNAYQNKLAKYGDVLEFDEHFSVKALKNPNWELVKPGPRPKTQD